ncbi:MAG: prenyltransferase/squalene oxidase repeat-containing protein [Candidatus Bathyarchaeia archaeon]
MLIEEVDSFKQSMDFERKSYVSRKVEESSLESVDLHNLYIVEMPTMLCNINMVTSAFNLLGYQLNELERENIVRLVLKFKNKDGGFGLNTSCIDETFHALSILINLKSSLNDLDLQNTIKWIYECENRSGGFKIKPDIPLSYSLEYTYYGLQAMDLLNIKPAFSDMHINFIYSCYNPNGGFRRSTNLGISTLEDTFYATSSLSTLNAILY